MMVRPLRLVSLVAILALPWQNALLLGAAGDNPSDLLRSLREMRAGVPDHAAPPRRGKCGLELTFRILDGWEGFSADERSEARKLLSAPATQNDRVIGHFHIYYDTTGPNTPALLDPLNQRIPGSAEAYVDSAGRILNHVWSFETGDLGYSPPPLGSDSTYHVTILELQPGLYGQTLPDPDPITPGPPPRYATNIEIDNDFRETQYFTKGVSAMEVTLAHEFHHAIQLGSYGDWGVEERYIYEITSTWMEDVVYNGVNDYYQYLSNDVVQTSQFSTPDLRFTKADQSIEYSRGIWGKFIEKRFSPAVMRRTWELMRQYRSLDAIDRALAESGSSLRAAFLEYAYWNFNTGPTADTARFYSEGRNYPQMRIASSFDYLPPGTSFRDSIEALSSTYERVCVLGIPSDTCAAGNSMFVIVSNVDEAQGFSDSPFSFTYSVNSAPIEGSKQLANGLYSKLEAAEPQFWSTQESAPSVISEVLVFPDPFRGRAGARLWFRFPAVPRDATASLAIFNSAMAKVFSGEPSVTSFRPHELAVTWDGRNDRGDPAPTGVYFFHISVDADEYIGKFTLIRN